MITDKNVPMTKQIDAVNALADLFEADPIKGRQVGFQMLRYFVGELSGLDCVDRLNTQRAKHE
jgi:hypothetical protein